ncbi:MAG: protein-L-isoaspartate(D-aspartate) O-methyltransferase [Desulfobacterales bacterium]|nr:protein-L-isoaspartate(D-aspartate) O-methyltransferase [Desulfobacterales bacterium]MBS3755494.1 protein-L-isoaspartate(D-aspartate) O-methyltransferase [Desulfobacterales bacterium]
MNFAHEIDPLRSKAENAPEFRQQRMQMIHDQLKARGIRDPEILKAFEKVQRHRFVPDRLQQFAYADRPLPIGEGQTISQPYIVAVMTRALELKKTDRVLEIGTGSGYQAAIIAELCDRVYTIEIIESLAETARKTLSGLGYENVHVKIGDGFKGWPEHAPFDAIIVTCAPTEIPEPLKEQLAEGGRMVIPVGKSSDQQLVLLEKQEGDLLKKEILPVLFVPMVDDRGKPY